MIEDGVITLANGMKIDTVSGKAVKVPPAAQPIAVPTTTEAQRLVLSARRKMSDLPALPNTMHLFAAVLSYTLFGLSDEEIAMAVDKPLMQVQRLKMLPEYATLYDGVVDQIMQAESNNVRDLFAQRSKAAADKVFNIMQETESESVALVAAKDILDRGGNRPADLVIENRQRTEAELTVRFVRQSEVNTPVLDLPSEEI